MEWEINPDQRSENNQPEPSSEQSIPPEPEPAPIAEEPELKELIPDEPRQNESTGKLPGFGYFFKETFSAYKNNFWKFLFISVIPLVVSFLFSIFFLKHQSADPLSIPSLQDFFPLIPIFLIIIIISLWANLSLLHAIKERENKISIKEALARGWSSLGSGIWVSFLTLIIVGAGFVLFIIPGIIFSIWFLLALYVLVDENKKGMDALKRSKELISGYLTAYWGRTFLFGLIFSVILFLVSFIIKFFSVFLPIINYLATIINVIAAPLFAIFSFLVYEKIKTAKEAGYTKSPREIKYILIFLLVFLLPIVGIFASILLINVNSARTVAKDASAISSMEMMRCDAELFFDRNNNSYFGLDCLAPDFSNICAGVKETIGKEPIVYSDQSAYCAYVKLLTSGYYYCLDSRGVAKETMVNPGDSGYCDGITFNCP
jgi:hypothetical protein